LFPFQIQSGPVFSVLVFEKWRDDSGQAWAHMTFNGSPCVVGDAVARQTAHPLLQQPLQLFPMEVLEQALEQVRPACSSGPREAALQSRVVWLVVFHSITLPLPRSTPRPSGGSAARACAA
jgi:hypothetical protein